MARLALIFAICFLCILVVHAWHEGPEHFGLLAPCERGLRCGPKFREFLLQVCQKDTCDNPIAATCCSKGCTCDDVKAACCP